MDNELFHRKNTTSELFMTQLLLMTCEHKMSTRGHVTDVNQWQSVYINTGDIQRRSLVNKISARVFSFGSDKNGVR